MKLLRYFLTNSKLKVARQMQYRVNFILGITIALAASAIGPLVQLLLFTRTNGYPGWTLHQIILFQGVLLVIMGLDNTLFGEVKGYFIQQIRSGNFDNLLLKPFPSIGIILASGANIENAGTVIAGTAVILYALSVQQLHVGILQLFMFILAMACGLLFHAAANVIYCGIGIRIVFMGRIEQIFDAILGFSNYPIQIFPRFLQLLFMFVVPFAVISYIPAQVLLNRYDFKILFALLASILFFMVSLIFWKTSMNKYTSAGG